MHILDIIAIFCYFLIIVYIGFKGMLTSRIWLRAVQ